MIPTYKELLNRIEELELKYDELTKRLSKQDNAAILGSKYFKQLEELAKDADEEWEGVMK